MPSNGFCLSGVRPQSWPTSLSASSSRAGDAPSADSSTWWRDIPSSQRTSWSRPSSPSAARYVVLSWLAAASLCGCCTISIIVMMTDSEMLPVPATQCLFPLTHTSPLFPHRMFRLSCVTLTRKRGMSSWPTESQPWQRFVTWTTGRKSPKYNHLTRCFLRAVLSLLCRNISPPTSRLSSQQAESWLEIFTTASKSFGTEPRKWRSARRRMQLISSCLAKSSGISLLWI